MVVDSPHTRAALAVAVAVAAGVAAWQLPVARTSVALVDGVRNLGGWGVALFALLYVVAAVLLIPGSVLTLGAGFAYGPWWGLALVSPVSVAAALIAFALARRAMRPWVSRRFAHHPKLAAVDRAVARRGGRIVLLLRLSPLVPYSALNYLCGLTRIDARRYVVASWLGMLPGTLLYTYLGSAATTTAELAVGAGDGRAPAQQLAYWGGLAATVLAAVVVTRVARAALADALAD